MVSKTFVVVLVLGICSSLPELCHANAFLRKVNAAASGSMNKTDVQASLLSEIISTMGSAATEGRLPQIEDALRPMYIALPKNEYGNLGHVTVRYALHRLFVKRHGWFIKGLEPAGALWNSSSPTEILTDRVPAYVQDLVEQRLGGHGLSLHEVAVLASTLEHLVHDETKEHLDRAFKAHGWSSSSRLSSHQVTDVLETYFAVYVAGDFAAELHNDGPDGYHLTREMIHEIYPDWGNTQKWLHGVQRDFTREEVGHMDPSAPQQFDFEIITRIADKLGEGFGQFQDKECQQLKVDLMAHSEKDTGRVRLSNFYKAALGGQWQFAESIGYLRQLGALDESDSKDPSVVVTNYISALSNCIASSAFYSVCCIDACEDLVGHLEGKLAAPQAEPARLAALVADLSSTTVPAPRTLSAALLQRLDEIAASNGGAVPLHGRLFAQWMHHAFPNECPFPHMSSTTSPLTQVEWKNTTGEATTATRQEMQLVVNSLASRAEDDGEKTEDVSTIPWAEEEELLVIRSTFGSSSSDGTWWAAGRNIVFIAAFSAMVTAMVRSTKASGKAMIAESHKMYV